MNFEPASGISFFQRYLTLWVLLCMAAGIAVGHFMSGLVTLLNGLTVSGISLPITVLIWIMIFPMMMKVDFESIRSVGKNPKGLFVTWIVNWLVKPFSMYLVASFFLMVLFPAYTVVQVATNDLIILVAFIPIVRFLLGVSQVAVPYGTLFLSVILFVLIPLVVGTLTRLMVTRRKGIAYFESVFLPRFDHVTMVGLLLTLVIIFASQAELILRNPFHIVLIALPLVLQTLFIFTVSFGTCRLLHLPFAIAAPAGMIGASNFFELAVAVAIALFGTSSPAALATTVGVLTEVPVMLFLVNVANRLRW